MENDKDAEILEIVRNCKFVLKNPPRTITKSDWKKIQHFLRVCRRKVAKDLAEIDFLSSF